MLIVNGKLITWQKPNRILDDLAIYIREGVIEAIGPQEELMRQFADAERIDARGQFIMPGIICGHTHFYGAVARLFLDLHQRIFLRSWRSFGGPLINPCLQRTLNILPLFAWLMQLNMGQQP